MSSPSFINFSKSGIKFIDGDRGVNYPNKSELKSDGHCVFLNTGNVKKTGFDFSQVEYIDEEKDSQLRKGKIEKGDIVLTTRGTVGNVAIVDDGTPYSNIRINSGMVIVRANPEEYDPYFILLFFRSALFEKQYLSHGSGSAQPQLPISALKNICFPDFDIEIQRAIVKAAICIDKKIELNNRINAELEAMAKTLYDYWFVQFDFPDDSPQGQSKPYKTSGGKMVYNSTLKRDIPEGWEVAPIAKYFNYQEGPGITKEKYANEGHNFINIKCIQDNDLDVSNASKIADKFVDAYSHFQLDENDIVLSTSGSLGRLAIVRKVHLPLLLNTSVIRFKAREFYYFEYLYCYLQSQTFIGYLNQLATGSIQKNFGPTHLAQIFETFPSENLMIEFSKLTGPILKKIISLRSETDELIKLRDWLLPMLMNGQVTVGEVT